MCSIVKEKNRVVVLYDGCSVGSLYSFRECVCVRRLRRRWWAAVRVPGGRWKTGNAAHRIDSHALPRRSEYWSRRPPAHVVRYVATPHDKESVFKKKKHLGIYGIPDKMHHHHRHGGGGDFFTHKRLQEPLGRRPRRILGFIIYLFSATYERSKICWWWFFIVYYDFICG